MSLFGVPTFKFGARVISWQVASLLALLFNDPSFASAVDVLNDWTLERLLETRIDVDSRKAESFKNAKGAVTVISRQQIEDMNARTLRDIVNIFVPSMDVVPTYFRYGDRVNAGFYSRGLLSDFSQQVLVLYNGKTKFNETTFGSAFPAIQFMLDNIKQVEVSRSPVPLYGGSAITIINLVTRERDFEGFEARAESSFNGKQNDDRFVQANRFSAVFGQSIDAWHYGAALQWYQDDGQAHPEPAGQGGYRFDGESLKDGTKDSLEASLSIISEDETFSFLSLYKFNNQDAFLSGQLPSQSSDLYNYEGEQWHASLSYEPSASWTFNAGLMNSSFTNFLDLDGEPYGGKTWNFDVFGEAIYFGQQQAHNFLVGLKLEREGQYNAEVYLWNGSGFDRSDRDDLIFAPNHMRTVTSLFAEDDWQVNKNFSVTLGARYDYYDGFGGKSFAAYNPRLAFKWEKDAFYIKGLYSSATRPPSIYETFGTALFPLLGSESIEAETVSSTEFILGFNSPSLRLELSPYYQAFKDKIEYLPQMDSFVAVNNGETIVKGVDFSLNYYWDKQSYFFASLARFNSEDSVERRDTFFIPNEYASFGLNYRNGKFNANYTQYYRGQRELPDRLGVNQAFASGSHIKADLSLSLLASDKLKFYLNIENLFDRNMFVPLSVDGLFVPYRGRTAHLGFSLNFSPN